MASKQVLIAPGQSLGDGFRQLGVNPAGFSGDKRPWVVRQKGSLELSQKHRHVIVSACGECGKMRGGVGSRVNKTGQKTGQKCQGCGKNEMRAMFSDPISTQRYQILGRKYAAKKRGPYLE